MATTHSTSTVDVAALRHAIRGSVLAPGDEGWDEARTPWNVAFDQQPAVIVVAANSADVQAAVRFATANGLRVAPQGTGHGVAGLGDLSDALLLRMHELRRVEIDVEAQQARVGAGAIWEDVVNPAAEHGLAVLHGSSPDVGVAGYTLGGGMGWLARKHGFAANSLTAIELVTADGEFHRVDHTHERDLFFALRGGGGNFGVVTAFEYKLFPLETVFAGWLIWPWEQSEQVLTAWRDWTETTPDEVTSVGRILQLPPAPARPSSRSSSASSAEPLAARRPAPAPPPTSRATSCSSRSDCRSRRSSRPRWSSTSTSSRRPWPRGGPSRATSTWPSAISTASPSTPARRTTACARSASASTRPSCSRPTSASSRPAPTGRSQDNTPPVRSPHRRRFLFSGQMANAAQLSEHLLECPA